jgi:arsenate reductase
LLTEKNVPFEYREYSKDPLSEAEIRDVFTLLKVPVKSLLRKNDKAYKELSLTGEEDDETLFALMAKHPTLLQRPIGILNGKAVVGRPYDRLLELL